MQVSIMGMRPFPKCLTTLWSGNRACQQMHEANRQLQTGPLCDQPWHILFIPQGQDTPSGLL